MKLVKLFIALTAAAAVFSACQEEKPVFGISSDTDAIEFEQVGGQAQVKVTTAQDWRVKIPSDAQAWLTAEPASGTGNATITFTAAANEGKDRKTSLKIVGMDRVSISVSQPGAIKPGDGLTPETAWSASEARAWIMANLSSGDQTSEKYYIKGIIHKVQTTFAASGTYGNAVFFISDDGQASANDFEAFQVYYLGGKQWTKGNPDVAVGDEVIIYGPVTLYNTTPETVGKGAAYVYSHVSNGTPSGGGGDTTDYSNAPAKTVAEFIAAADKDNYYKLTGTVSAFSATYCSFDLTDNSGKIYVYSVDNKDEWSSKISNGGTVVLAGKYEYYAKKEQHEVVNAYILSFEGDGQGGGGEVKDPKSVTIAEFNAAPESQDQPYQLTGKVSNITSTAYGNFDLSDDTGTVYVYGLTATNLGYGAKNDQSFGSLGVKDGDEITLIGFRGSYNDKIEVMYAYLVSGGNPGDNPGGGGGSGDAGEFASNVTMEKGTSCYDDNTLNVNGVNNVSNLKFGTSKLYGSGTVKLPAGTKEVTFYAIGWKGADASLKFTAGSQSYTFDVKGNDGASGSGPYNVTVTDSDKYYLRFDSALSSDTSVSVETYEGNNKGFRAFLFGVQAVK